jgi:hypothetical protein
MFRAQRESGCQHVCRLTAIRIVMLSFERVLVLAVATVSAANDPSPPQLPYPFGGAFGTFGTFGTFGREPLGSGLAASMSSDPANHALTVRVMDEFDLREATGVIVPTKVPDWHGVDDAALVGSTDHWRKLLNVTDNEDPRGVIELQVEDRASSSFKARVLELQKRFRGHREHARRFLIPDILRVLGRGYKRMVSAIRARICSCPVTRPES